MEKKIYKNFTLRQAEKLIVSGKTEAYFVENMKDERKAKELYAQAVVLRDSRKYLDSVKEKYISQRLRLGYVGCNLNSNVNVEFMQLTPGPELGFTAAVFDEASKKIYIGVSYISPDETLVDPIIGQAIALKRAIENKEKGLDGILPSKRALYRKALDYFYDRAKRYFIPEEFSHSRGKNPVKDGNFDQTHLWHFVNAAIKSKNKEDFDASIKMLTKSIKNLNELIKIIKNPNENVK